MADGLVEQGAGDRRIADRRREQVAIDFPDRREGERRSGKDRRAHPRS